MKILLCGKMSAVNGNKSMKYWQLETIFRDELKVLNELRRKGILANSSDYDQLVRLQNRKVLDAPVSIHIINDALSKSTKVFYIDATGKNVYSYPFQGWSAEISIFDLYKRVGADQIVDLLESTHIYL